MHTPNTNPQANARLTHWLALVLAANVLGQTGCQHHANPPTTTAGGSTVGSPLATPDDEAGPFVAKQFIYDSAPFPSCHASTIVDTPHGVMAAWFGGQDEGEPDVGIWTSRYADGAWTTPQMVAEGVSPQWPERYPCWNPVLFQMPEGPLVLFYKVGPNPRDWWGMRMESSNYGRTWSAPERLPEGIMGPVRNKPELLPNGMLLCGSSTEDHGWRVHMEQTPDGGRTWSRTPPLHSADDCGLIQPTLLTWPNGRVQILCRSRQGAVYESWMGDTFESWSKPAPIGLPNPNSGIDGVVLRDGRAVLIYNHTPKGRSPLNVAFSRDGRTWNASVVLEDEPGEYSYPAVIQSADGMIHITYTWKRERIRHVVLNPEKL
jgi:predicted neuraminidase